MKPNRSDRRALLLGAVCVGVMAAEPSYASLARNAAGAKNIGNAGNFTVDTAGQLERDADGNAWAFETSVQYQASKRLQLLVEAVPFESQQPHSEASTSGFGDTDLTLSWLAAKQGTRFASLVLGASIKVPTATQEELGTGKADYSALFVLGREAGELELNLETAFTTFGQSGTVKLKNQFSYTLSAEYGVNDYLSVYGELFGQSAPTAFESHTEAARAGLEVDIPVSESIAPYLSFELDTESVGGVRTGIEWTW